MVTKNENYTTYSIDDCHLVNYNYSISVVNLKANMDKDVVSYFHIYLINLCDTYTVKYLFLALLT